MNKLIVKSMSFRSADNGDDIVLDLAEDQIVVLVGSNNAGKSQALNDIYSQLGEEGTSIVVKSIEIGDIDKAKVEDDVRRFSMFNGSTHNGLDFTIPKYKLDAFVKSNQMCDGIRNFYSRKIKTEDRLLLANAPTQISPIDVSRHPIHYISNSKDLLENISNSFHDAFGDILQLDNYAGDKLPLRLGEPVLIGDDMNGKRADEVGQLLRDEYRSRPSLETQGDGMRSLAGILLYLHVPHYSTFFIDEPESFLHPPQALAMGRILCDHSKGKQLFIATHSEMLLKGLIEVAPERVKIIRVTRHRNENKIHYIGKDEIESIWNDPLLKYSNLMDSLFYPSTIVCESNADCKFYKMILDSINHSKGTPMDVMFVECGGKHRFHIVCAALSSLNVDFRVTPDFDMLRNEGRASSLYNACGGNWEKDCKADWIIADNSLIENPIELNKENVAKKIYAALERIPDGNLSKHDIDNIKDALKGKNKWDGPKSKGLEAFDDENAKRSINRILEKFKEKGIFLVPYGEMENFIPDVSEHGKEWLEKVLDKHKDLDDPIYNKSKEYLNSMNL